MKKQILLLVLLITAGLFLLTSCQKEDDNNPLGPGDDGDTTPSTYTLTYNATGGSGVPSAVAGLTNGQQVTLSNGSGMTKGGYTFAGWTNSAGTEYAGGSSYTMGSGTRARRNRSVFGR